MEIKLPLAHLPVFLAFALLLLKSTARSRTADVGDDTILKKPNCWKDVASRSDNVLPNNATGLVNINEFLLGVLENFREDTTSGIPDLKIPVLDPFRPPKVINIDIRDKMSSVKGNFSKLEVRGLSGFFMDHLNANLYDLSFSFSLRLPSIYAIGYYIIGGKIINFVPLRGNGTFWVESKNLTICVSAFMQKTDDGHLQVAKNFDIDIDLDEVQMDFENLFGGGRWTKIVIEILNNMSKTLFQKVLPLLKGELRKALFTVINKHLVKLPTMSIVAGSTANEYVDQIMANVRQYIQDNNYDHLKLPDYTSSFSKSIVIGTVHGEAKLYDGWLSGISSIHRTDECSLNATSRTIALSAHLGLKNLRINYKGHVKFMNLGPTIACGGTVSYVSFFFIVEQTNDRGATPHLRDLEVVEMSTIWIELSGLGPLTWALNWILTGMTKLIENFIVKKVAKYIGQYLEEEFQKVSFPL